MGLSRRVSKAVGVWAKLNTQHQASASTVIFKQFFKTNKLQEERSRRLLDIGCPLAVPTFQCHLCPWAFALLPSILTAFLQLSPSTEIFSELGLQHPAKIAMMLCNNGHVHASKPLFRYLDKSGCEDLVDTYRRGLKPHPSI